MSVNKAIIIGNLGSDPESIGNGKGCRFSVATNERWKDKSGDTQERTEWHRVTAWGRTGENCMKYLTKGRQVYVEGRIQTDEWEDDDGNTRHSTGIVALNVTFLSGGDSPSGGGSSGEKKRRKRRKKEAPANDGWGDSDDSWDDDDIPF